jgi:hypothetical protein
LWFSSAPQGSITVSRIAFGVLAVVTVKSIVFWLVMFLFRETPTFGRNKLLVFLGSKSKPSQKSAEIGSKLKDSPGSDRGEICM